MWFNRRWPATLPRSSLAIDPEKSSFFTTSAAGHCSPHRVRPAGWGAAFQSGRGPPGNGPMRFGGGSRIETSCVSSSAQSDLATGISATVAVVTLIHRSPRARTHSHRLHPTRSHLSHSKQEDRYDRLPAGSLDAHKHPLAWQATKVTVMPRELDPLCGRTGNPVQPRLHASLPGTQLRSGCHRLEDRRTPRTDRSRRTIAASIVGVARSSSQKEGGARF